MIDQIKLALEIYGYGQTFISWFKDRDEEFIKVFNDNVTFYKDNLPRLLKNDDFVGSMIKTYKFVREQRYELKRAIAIRVFNNFASLTDDQMKNFNIERFYSTLDLMDVRIIEILGNSLVFNQNQNHYYFRGQLSDEDGHHLVSLSLVIDKYLGGSMLSDNGTMYSRAISVNERQYTMTVFGIKFCQWLNCK